MIKPECINVSLGNRSYDIIIGTQLLNKAGDLIKSVIRSENVIIVTDTNVAPLYLNKLTNSLELVSLKVERIILPPGEQTKSISHFESLIDEILAMKIDNTPRFLKESIVLPPKF